MFKIQKHHKVNILLAIIFSIIFCSFMWFLTAYILKNKIHNLSFSLIKTGVNFNTKSLEIRGFPGKFHVLMAGQEWTISWDKQEFNFKTKEYESNKEQLVIHFPKLELTSSILLKNNVLDFGEKFFMFFASNNQKKLNISVNKNAQMILKFKHSPWVSIINEDLSELLKNVDKFLWQFSNLSFDIDGKNILDIKNFDWKIDSISHHNAELQNISGETSMKLQEKNITQETDVDYQIIDKKQANILIHKLKLIADDSWVAIKGNGSIGGILNGEYWISWDNIEDNLSNFAAFIFDKKSSKQTKGKYDEEYIKKLVKIIKIISDNYNMQEGLKIHINEVGQLKVNDLPIEDFTKQTPGLQEAIDDATSYALNTLMNEVSNDPEKFFQEVQKEMQQQESTAKNEETITNK